MANSEARNIVRAVVDATVVAPTLQAVEAANDARQILLGVTKGVGGRVSRRLVKEAVVRGGPAVHELVSRAAEVTFEVQAFRRRIR